MKNYTDKQGYILALIIAFIYAFASKQSFDFVSLLASVVGVLLVNIVLSGIITVFWKFKNFGRVLGITSILICLIAFLGNKRNDNEQKEKVEIEQRNYNTISENFKNVYGAFNNKLKTDNRKDILNNLILSNRLFDGDINEVSNQLDKVDEYYNWIKTTNDSLFTDLKKQLNDYKDEQKDESKKSEIEKNKMQIQMSEMNTTVNYMHETSIIFEMRNMISIKKRCKHEFKNGKLLFFDTNCLEDWSKAEVKLNESLKKLNLHRENSLK